jgi:hypothetical protein
MIAMCGNLHEYRQVAVMILAGRHLEIQVCIDILAPGGKPARPRIKQEGNKNARTTATVMDFDFILETQIYATWTFKNMIQRDGLLFTIKR